MESWSDFVREGGLVLRVGQGLLLQVNVVVVVTMIGGDKDAYFYVFFIIFPMWCVG